jgi:hypothetical protein
MKLLNKKIPDFNPVGRHGDIAKNILKAYLQNTNHDRVRGVRLHNLLSKLEYKHGSQYSSRIPEINEDAVNYPEYKFKGPPQAVAPKPVSNGIATAQENEDFGQLINTIRKYNQPRRDFDNLKEHINTSLDRVLKSSKDRKERNKLVNSTLKTIHHIYGGGNSLKQRILDHALEYINNKKGYSATDKSVVKADTANPLADYLAKRDKESKPRPKQSW